jgi:hypothetical protein
VDDTVRRMIVACDESGAKGYANQREQRDGEVGVFAGILIDATQEAAIRPDFQDVYDRFVPSNGKFHIADLDPAAQQALRDAVNAAVAKHNLPCFWYAIHAEGFYDFHATQRKSIEDALTARLARGAPRVKRGSRRENPPSMHVHLFSGLHAHVVAHLAEQNISPVEIEFRSDKIDAPIIAKFETEAGRLLDEGPYVKAVTGFDTVDLKVVHGRIEIQTTLPPELDVDIDIRRMTIFTDTAKDPFVLAADVIANSLAYLFHTRPPEEKYQPLNTIEAVRRHPLAANFDAFDEWSFDYTGDGIWSHPKSRQTTENQST